MKIKNARTEQYADYWDEGQKPSKLFRWYKKGAWKRIFRKKFIKSQLKHL